MKKAMIKNEPIIGVKNVAASSKWYQALLGCKGTHGGDTFETLADEHENIFLCLHKWGEHAHPTLSSPKVEPGNGLILYLRVAELDKTWKNAQDLNAKIEEPPSINPNSGKKQFCMRDLDGYYLIISL